MVAEHVRLTEYHELVADSESLRALDQMGLSVSELESLVDAQKRYNSALPGDEDIRRHFASLDNGQLIAYAQELADRLQEETTVLDPLQAEGLDPFARDLRDTYVPFPVKYVSHEELQKMNGYPKRTSACYRGGTIFVGGELPGLRERLATFATRGILSNDLFHEVYHGFQDGELLFASMEELLDYIANPRPAEWRLALAESHAWMSCLPGFRDDVLIPVILENYGIGDRRYLEAAFETVRALDALGLSDREIGRLIGQARWDEHAKGYKALTEEIERLARARGHTPAELEAVVEKHKLMERLQALRGMAIAAEMCQPN